MEHLGVVFEPGCSAVLNTEKGILEVTNTASQLKLMEKIVSKLPKLTFAEEKLLVSSIVRGPDLPTVLEENPTVEKIQEMLRETRIPDLKINKTTFFDALTIVQQKGVEFHPSRKGISLIIEGNPSPFIKKPVDYTPPSTSTTVSLHRRDVSLAEAFDDLAKQANFKYHVKPHAVIFTPAALPLEKLLTTMYLMPLKLHEKLMAYEEHGGTNPFGSPDGEEPVRTTQSAFESAGISFTDGAKVSYDKKTEELFITNTVDQMDLVEPFLSSLDGGKIILSHDSRYHRKSPDSE